ncbi:MAG: TonB-dependent receptor [Bacteroidetes bacterium]|nr:MAG: TonB-dependent receptor [Bacteroidota bacterium]
MTKAFSDTFRANGWRVLLVLLSMILLNTAFSQKKPERIGLLVGKVQDSISGVPVPYASVRLFAISDSTVRAGVYTDEKGEIKLDEIPLGDYYIIISFSSYQKKLISGINFTKEKPQRILGDVLLSPDTQDLKEVRVRAERDLLVNDIDKKVYDVSQDLSVQGGSVNDVLNNVPLIDVDQDGNISLRGDQNVTILIDGKPSALSGMSGQSLLDALPASSIERVEVVTNPSAKYDPDGTSGIINIVLKKNKLKGINGNVSLTMATGTTTNGSAGLSYRNARFNLYGTYSYRRYTGERGFESNLLRELEDSTFVLDQFRNGTDLNENHTLRLGADFYLNDRNTLGFSVTGNQGQRVRSGLLENRVFDQQNALQQNWNRGSYDPSENQSGDLSLSYTMDFKEGTGNWMTSLNHSVGMNQVQGFYEQDYLLINGANDVRRDLVQRLENKGDNQLTTIQSDYIRALKHQDKLELGAKVILRNSGIDTYSETQDSLTAIYYEDTLSNFVYSLGEELYSVYGNYGREFNKLKAQVGLRAEHAVQDPVLESSSINYRKEFNNLFPSAFLKYAPNEVNEWSMSYSKRINRPRSGQLNPFTSYADPYNLRRGNPDLNPSFIHAFNAGYSLNKEKINLTVGVFYRLSNNVISRVKEFYDNGATAVTFGNIDRNTSWGPDFVLTYKPLPWMKHVLSGSGNSIRYQDESSGLDLNNSGFFWNVKYTGRFEFWKKTMSLQLNANYNSGRVTAQGNILPRYVVDIALNKSFLEGKWNLGCRLSDVFNTREFNIVIDQPGSYQTLRFKQNTRRFFVTLSYKFGKYELKKDAGSGNEQGGGDF